MRLPNCADVLSSTESSSLPLPKHKEQQISKRLFYSTETWAGFTFQSLVFPVAFAARTQVTAPGLELLQGKRAACEFEQEIPARTANPIRVRRFLRQRLAACPYQARVRFFREQGGGIDGARSEQIKSHAFSPERTCAVIAF